MRASRKMMLAAGLIAGAAAMTGCTATTTPAATPTPRAAQQQTAEPQTAEPTAQASPQTTTEADEGAGEENAPLTLTVSGKELEAKAMTENDMLLLPLEKTGEALGYRVKDEETPEGENKKRVVTLEKDESRITVSWTVSDNTIRSISWQKDGLLIPVDTHITTEGETVYVPAAFFEEAADVRIERTEKGVNILLPEPKDTPDTDEQDIGENG